VFFFAAELAAWDEGEVAWDPSLPLAEKWPASSVDENNTRPLRETASTRVMLFVIVHRAQCASGIKNRSRWEVARAFVNRSDRANASSFRARRGKTKRPPRWREPRDVYRSTR